MVFKSSALIGGGSGGTGGGTVSSITSSGGTITVSNPTGPTTNIDVANNTANTLAGYDNSGVFSDVTIGSNLTLSGGTLSASGGGAVSSVFGRTGAVSANYGDYSFNLIGGTAAVSQGGTGQTSLTSHAVLLGEGAVTGVGFATTGVAARILIDQGNADPAFKVVSGDISAISTGAFTVSSVNAVAYPSAPSTNTVPVVTSSNQITYEKVPNAAILNPSVTVSGVSGVTGGGAVALGASITLGMAGNLANTLAGYNSSGVFSDVAVGSNLSLSNGTLISTTSPAAVTSVFGRTGAVVATAGDYGFSLISGTAAVSQGGTGAVSFTAHSVLLGEGTSAISAATTGTAARILIDQGSIDPAFKVLSGDSSLASTGAMINTAINGVAYPASPSTNTVPVVTGSNTVTYQAVPNAALANSAITIGAQTGLAGGGSVALGSAITLSMGTNLANTLAGYNSSGVFSDVAIGSNLSLSGGVLSATAGGAAVSSVFGRTGAVTAQWNDYNFNLISGTATASQGGTGLATLTAHAVLLGEGVSAVSFATTGTAARLLIDQGSVDPAFKVISGDISINSAGAVTIQSAAVTYAKMQNEAAYTLLGNNTGSVASTAAISTLIIGTPGYAATGYNFAQFTGNTNNYAQISLQNSSAGSSASVDYILTANDGSDSTHYADFGMNNSVSGGAAFTNPHAAYVYTTDNELDLGAIGASGVINFYTTGGTSAPVKAGFFDSSQKLNLVNGILDGLPYFSTATAISSTSAGASGQFLQSNGGVAAPAWASLNPVGNALFSNTTVPAGNTVANTTSPTTITSTYTIGANTLAAGDILKVRGYGVYSTTGVAPTLTGVIKFGSTTMLSTGAITTVTGVTNAGFWWEGEFVVQTIGSSGTIEAQGYAEFATAATTGLSVNIANTAAITVNTTISQAITIVITWGTADPGNTITFREVTVEKLTTSAGPVASVSNADGTLTISPTTGSVISSLNLAHANTWTATQTGAVSGGVSSFISQGCIEFSIFANGNSGSSKTIKWDNGNIQTVTITGAVTLGFTNPTYPGRLTVISTMSATSGYSYAYPGTVLWPSGTKPTLSSISNARDVASFIYDGTNIYGIANTAFA